MACCMQMSKLKYKHEDEKMKVRNHPHRCELTVKWENLPQTQIGGGSWSTVKRADNIWHFGDECLGVWEWGKEATGTKRRRWRLKMQCVFSGREAVRGGRQFELEGRQKEAGRGWKRQRMGRKDRWMWSDAGTTPDTWHRNREGFHTFHSKLSFSVNLSVSRPGVALENTHFSHSCRSRRQYCHCFDVQEKAGGGKKQLSGYFMRTGGQFAGG